MFPGPNRTASTTGLTLCAVSISATASSASFNGDDASSDFPLPFRVLEDDDLLVRTTTDAGVTYTTLALDDDYTLDGTGPDDGTGTAEEVTLTLTAGALASGTRLVVERNTDLTQETAFQPQGTFSPITVSRIGDKNTLGLQDLERRVTALEALSSLLEITGTNSANVVWFFDTDADAVEETFPFEVDVVGGATALAGAFAIYLLSDIDHRFDTPPFVQWVPGPGAKITIVAIDGLEPGTSYVLRGVVFSLS